MSLINVSDYANLNNAVAALASGGTIYLDCPTTCVANLTIPKFVTVIGFNSELVNQGTYTVLFNGPLVAGEFKIFSGTGAITFGKRTVYQVTPSWWGFDEAASPSTNATALNSAYASNAPGMRIPNGSYDYDSGVVIDRTFKLTGSGSCDGGGVISQSSSWLNYTGSGCGIEIVGSTANGKENIHLSDFVLVGTSAASHGIRIGSDSNGFVLRSTFKNIKVGGFTRTGAYGFWFNHTIGVHGENLYAHGNYDGFGFDGVNTTHSFVNCQSRLNNRKGWMLKNLNVGTFTNCVGESNFNENVCVGDTNPTTLVNDVSNLKLINWDSENNQRSGGAAPIAIYAGTRIDVIGGNWGDPVSGRSIYFDRAESCMIDMPGFSTFGSGFAYCTSNTYYCTIRVLPTYATTSQVTGNGTTASGAYRVSIVT
jgi:hypothetical protein